MNNRFKALEEKELVKDSKSLLKKKVSM